MGSFSIWHWLIVLVIVMLVFGTKKLGNIGEDLGKAIKGFKDGVKGEEVNTIAVPVIDHATGNVTENEKSNTF